MRIRNSAATLLISCSLFLPAAAFAEDGLERNNEGDIEQVIPPAMVDEKGHERSEPIDFDEIVITDRTPADQFVSATTPLVVALMLGSIGLVVYTLARGDKFN